MTERVHLAFGADDNAAVDAFLAGGRGRGYPLERRAGRAPEYHGGYYAAYVLDPDGNNVEAVCHNRP